MSAGLRDAAKLKLTDPSVSTVIDGETRRDVKIRSRSLALNTADATSSWIDFASFAANRSFVGVVIRSTSTTRIPSASRSLRTAFTSEDFPYRRGAITATFWPFRRSAFNWASSSARSVNCSSETRSPKVNGFRTRREGLTGLYYTQIYNKAHRSVL